MWGRLLAPGLCALAALTLPGRDAVAAELPPAAKAIVSALKLDPALLAGMDEEAALPAGWREKARQEGPLQVIGSWDPAQFEKMTKPFHERYPDVRINYAFGPGQGDPRSEAVNVPARGTWSSPSDITVISTLSVSSGTRLSSSM